MIIFVIIVVIQFVVITKGATRISEVAARFALDGMPGRQMAIDADLNAGIIDENEAQRRRSEITQQADFFGAMDGASKFVRGDAIAGIIITLINIVGGLFIGMVQGGMTLRRSRRRCSRKLTIGDGLVSQVPAFLISLAAGLLVTRSTQKSESAGRVHAAALFAAAGAGRRRRLPGHSGLHQPAADSAVGARRRAASRLARDADQAEEARVGRGDGRRHKAEADKPRSRKSGSRII